MITQKQRKIGFFASSLEGVGNLSPEIRSADPMKDDARKPGAFAASLIFISILSSPAYAQSVLPVLDSPEPEFQGRTFEGTPPDWPHNPAPPPNAPNVILILTDDVGFSATSTYGGPVPTPTFDALAEAGLRYTRYHNAAICSATRAALLTGRNEHAVGMGRVANAPTGFPGYNSVIPKSAGTVAEVLKQHGYSTAAFGKWHLTPEWEESHAIGPFDRWPTGMGFEHYYGFIGADTDQFTPALTEGTTPVEPPHDDPTYILDRDLADRAISWIRTHEQLAPEKPFFVYYATGSTHAPHQAPAEWLAQFRGKFDVGWDEIRAQTFARQKALGIIPQDAQLTPRPDFIPAWNSLSANQKEVYARFMEAYAAQLAFADRQIGRVISELDAIGERENTLVIFIQGDNGASGEGSENGSFYEQQFINRAPQDFDYFLRNIDKIGGPDSYTNYPTGWAWATNTPFQYYKQIASHLGGLRDGMVVSWPEKITEQGGLRQQFSYVTDIAPTILEAAGVEAPARLNGVDQMPIDGKALNYSFADPAAPSRRKTQVFEMMENLGIYHDGWWANTTPSRQPWDFFKVMESVDPNDRTWQLYNIGSDYSQSHDLADRHPSKLRQMQQIFWAEAGRNKLLPIHSNSENAAGAPSPSKGRKSFSFTSGVTRVPARLAPETIGQSYTIEADITTSTDRRDGVLVTHGGKFGGYALYLNEGVPVFHYNAIGERQYQIRGSASVEPGRHVITARFVADSDQRGAGGWLTLSVDGRQIAKGRIEHTLFARISLYEGFDVGEDTLSPVNTEYDIGNSKFDGELNNLIFHIDD